jgi:preprotein translocase SecE subunit
MFVKSEYFVTRASIKENRIQQYVRETWAELRKVNWPTLKEAENLSIVVIVTIFLMSVFLGMAVDGTLSYLVSVLLNR